MNIKNIKNYLRTKVGSNIVIIYYGSRNRKEKYNGVLYKLYGHIFAIKLYNGDVKSFSYSDILTKTIQICI
jgi:uncharacterized protein Veg